MLLIAGILRHSELVLNSPRLPGFTFFFIPGKPARPAILVRVSLIYRVTSGPRGEVYTFQKRCGKQISSLPRQLLPPGKV